MRATRKAVRIYTFVCLLTFASNSTPRVAAAADDEAHSTPHSHARPDDHAPIGVMAEHVHAAGEWMLSYRYSRMIMEGNRDGTDDVPVGEILMPPGGTGTYMASPLDMEMQMHMFGLMYAPTNWVTLTAMIPFVELGMDHLNAMGVNFRTESDGVGDFKLGGIFPVFARGRHKVLLNTAFSFPTGSIDHVDFVPGMGIVRLPYPMQISSGTYDLIPGATYLGKTDSFSWGAQALGTIRLNTNDNGWKRGDRFDLTGWAAYPLAEFLSMSARISYAWWGNVRGADPTLNPAVVPTADPNLRAGNRLDFWPGVNFLVDRGPLEGHRFSLEAGIPMYQSLDGPQLKADWRLVVGWQKAF